MEESYSFDFDIKDESLVSYKVDFVVAVTLVVIVALLFAIAFARLASHHELMPWRGTTTAIPFHLRWGHPVWTFAVVIATETYVSLLTWFAVAMPMDYVQDNQAPLISFAGILMAALFLWVPVVCPMDVWTKHKTPYQGFAIFIATVFLLIPSIVLIAIYCKNMDMLTKFSNVGAISITGISVENITAKGNFRLNEYEMYFGKPVVSWNPFDACPTTSQDLLQIPQGFCRTEVFDKDCIACQNSNGRLGYGCQGTGGPNLVTSCVRRKYNLTEIQYDFAAVADTQSVVVGPDVRIQASDVFLANCNTCEAIERGNHQQQIYYFGRIRKAGAYLFATSLTIYALVGIWNLFKHMHESTRTSTQVLSV